VDRFKLLLAGLVLGLSFLTQVSFATLSGSLSEKEISLRLQPEGEVNVDRSGQVLPSASAAAELSTAEIGQRRYEETCHICHGPGLAGAPKFGDKADWAPRIAQGFDILVKRAIQGYKAMPPKGTCMACSDEEIKKSVEYMVSHSQ
jgi:cytochrome c5